MYIISAIQQHLFKDATIPKMDQQSVSVSKSKDPSSRSTGELPRLGRCFIYWAIAVVGKGNQLQVHHFGPIYETLAQSK